MPHYECELCKKYVKKNKILSIEKLTYCFRCYKIIMTEKMNNFNSETLVVESHTICFNCNKSKRLGNRGLKTKNMKLVNGKPFCMSCYYKMLPHLVEVPLNDVEMNNKLNKHPSRCTAIGIDPRSLYNQNGNRLCDAYDCNISGVNLNNSFKGFFCDEHLDQLIKIRDRIKKFPNTLGEVEARFDEINFRKNIDQSHVDYAIKLRNVLASQEREYINTLFAMLPY